MAIRIGLAQDDDQSQAQPTIGCILNGRLDDLVRATIATRLQACACDGSDAASGPGRHLGSSAGSAGTLGEGIQDASKV